MAINGTITASAPTSYGVSLQGVRSNLILTFPMAANTSVAYGDLVMLSSGYVTKCTGKASLAIGMANAAVDNTTASAVSPKTGAAADKYVPVIIVGVIEQDAYTKTTNDASLAIGTKVYLTAAVASYAAGGQAVTAYNNTSTLVGHSLDVVTATASDAIAKVRVLIDFASRAVLWA